MNHVPESMIKYDDAGRLKVSVEYIQWLEEERSKINRHDLGKIDFFEGEIDIKITPEILDDFRSTGLNNISFITADVYRSWDAIREELDHGLKIPPET